MNRLGAVISQDRDAPPEARRRAATLVAIGLSALLLLLAFDLSADLPLDDEWLYRWPLQRLVEGHGFHLWPGVVPFALPQYVILLPAAALHLAPRLWRLAVLPFLALAGIATARAAGELGASRRPAAVAGVALALSPLTLSIATGLMSDVFYLGLLMAGAWAMLRFLARGEGGWWLVAAVAAGTLERQNAAGLPVALAVGLLARPWPAAQPGDPGAGTKTAGRRPPARLGGRDATILGATIAVAAAGIAAPYLTGLATYPMRHTLNGMTWGQAAIDLTGTLLSLPPTLGLVALPLAWGLLRDGDGPIGGSRWTLAPAALATAALVGSIFFAAGSPVSAFPGPRLTPQGLGPIHHLAGKPELLPRPLYVALELLATASYLVILVRRRGVWVPRALGPAGIALVTLAATQLLPLILAGPNDRYELAVVVPLLPILAAAGPARGPGFERWAIAALAGGVLLYAVGQQDDLAWQAARDRAAAMAIASGIPADRLEAGYERVATSVAVPAEDAGGRFPASVDPTTYCVRGALAGLAFAPTTDPRPGVGYVSIAPARIVIVQRPFAACAPR
jgi:hypothetical protein